MNTAKQIFAALFLIALTFVLNLETSAQKSKVSLPDGLTEKPTLAEVLAWLDKNGFAGARIGFQSTGANPTDAVEASMSTATFSNWAVFGKGFRLSKTDGCRIVLKNDSVDLLEFSTQSPYWEKGSFANFRKAGAPKSVYAGNLYIALDLLSYKKMKDSYRLTDKKEKSDLLGTWQTKFYGKGDKIDITKLKYRIPSVKTDITYDLLMEIVGSGVSGGEERMGADYITFTFDDKDLSDKFYAVFRRAIELCK
jgi:hypothetical protein